MPYYEGPLATKEVTVDQVTARAQAFVDYLTSFTELPDYLTIRGEFSHACGEVSRLAVEFAEQVDMNQAGEAAFVGNLSRFSNETRNQARRVWKRGEKERLLLVSLWYNGKVTPEVMARLVDGFTQLADPTYVAGTYTKANVK